MRSPLQTQKSAGVTLLEILAVLAIISIIAMIAYPSYLEQVRKSRRAVAKSALLDVANKEEQNFFSCRAYSASMTSASPAVCPDLLKYQTDPAYFGKDGTNLTSGTDAVYAVGVSAVDTASCGTAPCFKIQAVPQGDQSADTCGTFTLTSDNQKAAATTDCW